MPCFWQNFRTSHDTDCVATGFFIRTIELAALHGWMYEGETNPHAYSITPIGLLEFDAFTDMTSGQVALPSAGQITTAKVFDIPSPSALCGVPGVDYSPYIRWCSLPEFGVQEMPALGALIGQSSAAIPFTCSQDPDGKSVTDLAMDTLLLGAGFSEAEFSNVTIAGAYFPLIIMTVDTDVGSTVAVLSFKNIGIG